MAAFAALIKAGKVKDTVSPKGDPIPLFVRGNIPNHGVLGRAGAAGYLRRVTRELGARGLETSAAASAAEHMQASSDLFKVLRYEQHLAKAGAVLAEIAAHEVAALGDMTMAWDEVRIITERAPIVNPIAAE
jgi:hypothetical protein